MKRAIDKAIEACDMEFSSEREARQFYKENAPGVTPTITHTPYGVKTTPDIKFKTLPKEYIYDFYVYKIWGKRGNENFSEKFIEKAKYKTNTPDKEKARKEFQRKLGDNYSVRYK